jgi:hypothetical protein
MKAPTVMLAKFEEAHDVRVSDAKEHVKLMAEDTVEAFATTVDLDSGERTGEARELNGAEPVLAHHSQSEPARHPLPMQP